MHTTENWSVLKIFVTNTFCSSLNKTLSNKVHPMTVSARYSNRTVILIENLPIYAKSYVCIS